jgi:O-antigen/teichoic acid export membrane protein
LAAIIALNRKIRIKKLEWDWSYFISVLKKSAPYALLVLLMLIYNRSDSIILREWSENGDLEAGIYAQGFRLFDAMYMVGMIFAGMLFPLFSRMLFEKDPSLNDLLNTAAKLLIGGTMAAVFVLIVNGHEILSLIYKERVESSSFLVFCLLMLAMLSMSFNFVFGTLLTANGSLKSLNVISGVAALTSIGLNLLLVIPFGAIGSALAALIVQTVVSIAIVRIAVKRLQLLNLRLLALNLFGLFCFLVSGWAIISLSDFVALTPFLSIGIALTGIYVFRILNLNSFTKAFIKQEKRGN